ncbi:hypothetical protein G9A89_012382 [Geosiphon pyriformis]|nr:hypothetical protein G9A89_012382 [Geosiphon pyriformis]
MAKIPQHKVQRKLKNVVDKIMTKSDYTKNLPEKLGLGGHNNFQKTINLYTDKTKWLFDTIILRQLEQFVGKNNLTTQAQAIYRLYMEF